MRERNPTDLHQQEKAQEQQAAADALAHEQEKQDILLQMSSPSGRRFVWGLLGRAGVFRTSFTGNSTTFFNEGRREIGLQYLHLINEHCPELYHVMVTEANKPEELSHAE